VDATTAAVEDYRLLASSAARAAYAAGIEAGPSAVAAQWAWQAALLRDIFNPFRPMSLDHAWRTPTVIALARAAYQERLPPQGELDLARLGVLADALEEAGCTEQRLLKHLRGLGPHCRGCWALDLMLRTG
jgi:hypothetical protein